jgi:hypothetical protein
MTYAADAPALPSTEIPPEAEDGFRLLAELQPADGRREPLEPARWVAMAADGTFALLEFAGSTVRQIGPRVGFDGATDIAAAICAGNARARTEPFALHALALALIGGVARKKHEEAARRRAYEAAREGCPQAAGAAQPAVPPDAAGAVPPAASPRISPQTGDAA